jgi:hypothetical protein
VASFAKPKRLICSMTDLLSKLVVPVAAEVELMKFYVL